MRERGVLLIGRGIWYLSTAHSEADVDAALRAADEIFQWLGSASSSE
jgi:glutamate-1-semialdehyde aminotransferase